MDFGFSGSGEHLRLYNEVGELINELTYDDEAPWPSGADGEGATLELIDAEEDNTLPQYWMASRQDGGTPGGTNSVSTGVEEPRAPRQVLLEPNHPNPFTRSTRIAYRLEQAGHVRLDVYDVAGRLVQTLVNAHRPAAYDVVWHPTSLSAGVYYYRLAVDGLPVQTRRAVLLRRVR